MRTFEVVEIEARDAGQHPQALDEMMSGESFSGMIVRNVFDTHTMARVVERLRRGETALISRPSPHYTGRMFGRILPHEQDLDTYFSEAAAFPVESEALFRDLGTDFNRRLEEVLGALADGKPVELARTADGRAYQAFSIREYLPGAFIGIHYENEAFDSPSMEELLTHLAAPQQLSAYLALALPEEGGDLCVYPLRAEDPETPAIKHLDRAAESTYERVESIAPRRVLDARVGDLLVFDAGRHFHRVTRIGGTKSRWTMGSFLGLSRGEDAYLYFS